MLRLAFILLVCANTVSASDGLPKFLSFGYQVGFSKVNQGTQHESYIPDYPIMSFEGFAHKQFYFQIDFTNFIVLAGQNYISPNVFSNSFFYGNRITDLTSALRLFGGNIKLTKHLNLLPAGIDLNRLSYTAVYTSTILYTADIGYTAQLIYRHSEKNLHRLIYAYCFNFKGSANSIHKIEYNAFLPTSQNRHWGVGAFAHFRMFTQGDGPLEPLPGNLFGLKLYFGKIW